jgi:hypothetical protein
VKCYLRKRFRRTIQITDDSVFLLVACVDAGAGQLARLPDGDERCSESQGDDWSE